MVITWVEERVNNYFAKLLNNKKATCVYLDTDSVTANSIIDTSLGRMRIEDFYNLVETDYRSIRLPGRDDTDFVFDVSGLYLTASSYVHDEGAIQDTVLRVMKHDVEKEFFLLEVDGRSVEITADHSLVVLRDGVLVEVKPVEVVDGDIFVYLHDEDVITLNKFVLVSLGVKKQTVYDLQTERSNCFFANDILVHNSIYLTLDDLVKKHIKDQTNTSSIVDTVDKWSKQIITPFISKCCKEFYDYLNNYANHMNMKRENIADVGIWTKKKRYILHVYDSEGVRYAKPEVKVTGLESVRSSTPKHVREKIKETIRIITTMTEEDVRAYVKNFEREWDSLPVETIAKPTGVNDIEDWTGLDGRPRSGAPAQVRGSILYNRLLKEYNLENLYPPIRSGDKVRYVYLLEPNHVKSHLIAFPDKLPPEFKLHNKIDRVTQFQKVYLSPISTILDAIGWQMEERCDLSDLFG